MVSWQHSYRAEPNRNSDFTTSPRQNLAKNWVKHPPARQLTRTRWPLVFPRHQLCILDVQTSNFCSRVKFSMQTSTNNSTFFKKNDTEMLCLALCTLAIIAFLSIAFLWFDATNLPASNFSIDETHQPAIKTPDFDQPAPSQNMVAVASSPLAKAPFEFASNPHGSLNYRNLNATFTLDKMVWRYTTDGWQDISKVNNRSQTPKPLLENVHPAIWTAMLILASLLLLLMFCSQRDVDQLLSPASASNGSNKEVQPNK